MADVLTLHIRVYEDKRFSVLIIKEGALFVGYGQDWDNKSSKVPFMCYCLNLCGYVSLWFGHNSLPILFCNI